MAHAQDNLSSPSVEMVDPMDEEHDVVDQDVSAQSLLRSETESQQVEDAARTEYESKTNGSIDPELQTRKLERATARSALAAWRLEDIFLIIAVACFAAILGLLTVFNGKPKDDWKLPFQISTVVAVLGAFFRIGLESIVSEGWFDWSAWLMWH